MVKKKEYRNEKIGIAEIDYFERVGLKLYNESMANFVYRLRIEHEGRVGGFGKQLFR